MDRSEYRDCEILSVAELAHSLDFDMARVVEAPNNLTQLRLLVLAAFKNDALP
jgi:predicted Ser/Thr protein kinase